MRRGRSVSPGFACRRRLADTREDSLAQHLGIERGGAPGSRPDTVFIDTDRFIPSGVWHLIVDRKRPWAGAEGALYGSFPVPRPCLTDVRENDGDLTLTVGWEYGLVIIEHAQRAFHDARALTPQDLSDVFFALWRVASRARA